VQVLETICRTSCWIHI